MLTMQPVHQLPRPSMPSVSWRQGAVPTGPVVPRRSAVPVQRRRSAATALATAVAWQRRLPNVLTAMRVLMVLPIVVLFYTRRSHLCALLFAVASLTDFLDGYLARRWQVQSPFGKFLDPVADKLLASAVLVLLPSTSSSTAPLLAVPAVLIILREILVSALREWTALAGESALSQVGVLGKLKTATILISLCGLLASSEEAFQSMVFTGSLVLLYVGAILAYVSSVDYIIKSLPAFRSKN
ncbi:unnamed protein product [Cladocopium goreaui]|uniref:CDP-diacylglycerol--glycerol-3-phosphate 3-phosphatidyltransferase n=1 Tax=Cladocopium goreaui TaxID=2562237 RepID=A0A9P1FMN7_9DINO|nr:unnamed protein product [Cladocopium goreaui]